MNRVELVRKLRALAADPAAAPNEREVATLKADALEARAPEPLPWPQATVNTANTGWWYSEAPPGDWADLFEPIRTATGYDLGAYSTMNLHRALHIMPDGSMNCKCHGASPLDPGWRVVGHGT